jgi:hypothetical protein
MNEQMKECIVEVMSLGVCHDMSHIRKSNGHKISSARARFVQTGAKDLWPSRFSRSRRSVLHRPTDIEGVLHKGGIELLKRRRLHFSSHVEKAPAARATQETGNKRG